MTDQMNDEIKLIKRKKKKNIIREIYLYDHTIVKRFLKIAPLPDIRRVWQMEDSALRRLSGLAVPKTYGFVEKQFKGVKEIIYAREFLDGEPIDRFEAKDIEPLARTMTHIHKRGVITRDPAIENFIKSETGDIIFIDFGRAVVIHPKGPAMIYYIGKELARIKYHALSDNYLLYDYFIELYFQFFPQAALKRKLIESIGSIWSKRQEKLRNSSS